MRKLVVTDKYLFNEKEYPIRKQIGIVNPEALWKRMYRLAQEEHPVSDEEHRRIANEECKTNYGYYYEEI